MRRRHLLATVIGVVSVGEIVGTGAFDQVEASRTVSVETSDDDEAYLQLVPSDQDYVNTNDEGLVRFEFNDEFFGNPDAGDGVNSDATFEFYDILGIQNAGEKPVKVFSQYDSSLAQNELNEVALLDSNGEKLTETNLSSTINVGSAKQFGMFIDTVGLDTGESYNVGLTITAVSDDSEEYPDAF
jgi:hypothetical protein